MAINKEIKKETKLALVDNSVVGLSVQQDMFINATKDHQVIPIDDIMKNKGEYENWFNNKGKLKPQLLKNEIFILQGQGGDQIFLLGDRLNYMDHHKSYKELGFSSMNEFFEDESCPIKKSTGYNAMQINKRFNREQCIMLGSKVQLLASLVEDLDKKELNKLMTKIAKMTYRESYNYLKNYKKFLLTDQMEGIRKNIERDDVIDLSETETEKYEKIEIVFDAPVFKVKGGKKTEFIFEEEWENQICNIALRKLLPTLQKEMTNIINSEEYSNYRKLAMKKYKK